MRCIRVIMMIPLYISFEVMPPYYFYFSKSSCTHHNLVTIRDILMKPHRNVYQIKIMCNKQLQWFSFSELPPFRCVYAYFV